MMYRVKITHCAPIIENILGANYPYYLKDDHDLWIEVDSDEEASIIENIELLQTKTFQEVQVLENLYNELYND